LDDRHGHDPGLAADMTGQWRVVAVADFGAIALMPPGEPSMTSTFPNCPPTVRSVPTRQANGG